VIYIENLKKIILGGLINLSEQRTNKLNPTMMSSLGIEAGPQWWEANAPTTTPPLLSTKTLSKFSFASQ